MEFTKIRFSKSETYLGSFHKIEILIHDPADKEKTYNEMVYWVISGYELPKLIDQLVSQLQSFHYKEFPDMLRRKKEEKKNGEN